MKLDILGKLLGIFQILVAIWYFDWNNWTQISVSTVLFLSGISILSRDAKSEPIRKTGRFLLWVGFIVAIFLIFKVLFVG